MTATLDRLPVTERARMMRELELSLMKDKTYRERPIGRQVGKYLRELRWTGGTPNTIEAYESVLAAFSRDFQDLELDEFAGGEEATELLMWWLDKKWGESALATRRRNTAIVRSFFRWAHIGGLIATNPAERIRGPKGRNHDRMAYDQDTLQHLVSSQETLRDQCAMQLLCRMGLRKEELRVLQIRDVDLVRDLVTVHGKGAKVAILPVSFKTLRDDLYLHVQGDERRPDEFLLYPHTARQRAMDRSSIHRWFKRCLELAGLPGTVKMHELRHSAADNLWRVTGNIVLAQQLLRHTSVGTTQDYLHPTRDDLSEGMRLVEKQWVKG